ncbi:MAG: nucleotidyltransferase domain-containing protein [Armatimonadetes bacterium]|nr:nucleotidyltransferase domain-containing protein [Armatimonadota bacterium]
MTASEQELLAKVKRAVLAVEPAADVILYGSRARGEAEADADWDILVLLDGPADADRIARARRQVYEVEWETGEVLSTIVESREQWDSPLTQGTPFRRNVEREGVPL